MKEYKKGYITTYTGKFVNPLDLQKEDVCIEDIAHSLSLKCRFNGHCISFYSIAQHCCLAAKHTNDISNKALALLHDSAEAYLFDIPKPLKESEDFDHFSEYENAEMNALHVILTKYNIFTNVKTWSWIDYQLLINECQQLLTNLDFPIAKEKPEINIPVVPWSSKESESQFITIARLLGIKD